MQHLQQQIEPLSEGNLPENMLTIPEDLLLAIGADAVMVPFGPNGGQPHGRGTPRFLRVPRFLRTPRFFTVWRGVNANIGNGAKVTLSEKGAISY